MSASRPRQTQVSEVSGSPLPSLCPLLWHCGCSMSLRATKRRPPDTVFRSTDQLPPPPPPLPVQAPRVPLDQLVQSALQDLLNVAGLEHEDSWEAAAPAPLPQPAPQQALPPRASASGQAAAAAATAPRRPSVPSNTSELAAVYAPEEPLPSAAGFEDEEAGLPAAAALRLYQARLRAAQADLTGLQATLKAKEAKLGSLEKELQQLRWALEGKPVP